MLESFWLIDYNQDERLILIAWEALTTFLCETGW